MKSRLFIDHIIIESLNLFKAFKLLIYIVLLLLFLMITVVWVTCTVLFKYVLAYFYSFLVFFCHELLCAWFTCMSVVKPGHEKIVSYVICEQQRRRSACASAQSDQRLCCSLLRKYNISKFYSRNSKTLASFCGCAGRFVSSLVGNSRRHILSCLGSFTSVPYVLRECYYCAITSPFQNFLNNE